MKTISIITLKTLMFLIIILKFNILVAQSVVAECFVSEGYHFNGGRIFINENKFFVVSEFYNLDNDPKNRYPHKFLIQNYDSSGNKVSTLFDSGKNFYDYYLSDVILFNNHFIVASGSQGKTKILVIDLKGKILKEKTLASYGGLLSNNSNSDKFLFIDSQKKEFLFDLYLKEYNIPNGKSICEQFFNNEQFYLNSSGFYTTYSRPINTFFETEDSVLFKNQIGGCYDGNVIKPDKKTNIILGCKFDPNFNNDIIGVYKIDGPNSNELATFKLGDDGHHWVYDAVLFNGDVYVIFSSGSKSKKIDLGFKNVDQFMWLARINIQK
jgi:hypothetical protein